MSEPLYAIVARYQDDLAKLQDLDLPPEVVADTIEGMQGEIEEKLRAVVAYAIDLEKAAEARATEAARMKDSASRFAARADALRTYALGALQASGLRLPLIAPEFTLNVAKVPPSVEVADASALPDAMVKTTVTIEFVGRIPDTWAVSAQAPAGAAIAVDTVPVKKMIGDALKDAVSVPGAALSAPKFRLTVR